MTRNSNHKGFTLIEILLYMTIATVILFAIISFSMGITDVNRKTVDMQEIATNMDYIGNKLSFSVYSATSIDSGNSIFSNDTGKLSLNMPIAGDSPTSIYLDSGWVYLKEGNSAAIKINSDSIKCTQLRFLKISNVKVPDQVVVDMQCEPFTNTLPDLKQDFKIHTSLSLRR